MKKYLTRLLSLLLALVLLLTPAYALTVGQALDLLETYYYYEIPKEAYEAQTMEELIRILGDPYTDYMTEEEYKAFLDLLEGDTNLVGIGVSIQLTHRGILVVDTIAGGSAREAGLQAGDLIIEVNGVSCVPATQEASELIAGDEGTQVSITVLRGEQTIPYTLTRRQVIIPNVDYRLLEGGVGYIECNSFGQDTGAEFTKLVSDNDSQVRLWILDLRGNGGGYADAAVEMVNALMGPGYYLFYEDGDGTVTYVPGQKKGATAKPVILLTDGASASASEIVASNIRDGGRGITVGGRTYGKGVAQIMLDGSVLPSYFEGDSLKLTAHRFYSGLLNTTDKVGVIPTLLVDDDDVDAVSLALCGDSTEANLGISFRTNLDTGRQIYSIDPNTDSETLSALLSALPPQILVSYTESPGWHADNYTAPQIAEKLGIEYESRWFTDVADSRYADAINAMGTYGLLQGDGKGHFTPAGNLTRAELCTMLANVLNVTYTGPTLYTDVNQDEWYGPSVNAMAYLGLVQGVGGGKFNPNHTLTQEEFFTIMGRVARFLNLEMDAYAEWTEEKEDNLTLAQRAALSGYSDWARTSMAVLAWGVDEGFEGEPWSKLGLLYAPLEELIPSAPILREEAAAGMFAVLAGLDILPVSV